MEFDYSPVAGIGAEVVGIEVGFGRPDRPSWVKTHGGVRYAAGRRLTGKKSLRDTYVGG
jgi:hypothetical protein